MYGCRESLILSDNLFRAMTVCFRIVYHVHFDESSANFELGTHGAMRVTLSLRTPFTQLCLEAIVTNRDPMDLVSMMVNPIYSFA